MKKSGLKKMLLIFGVLLGLTFSTMTVWAGERAAVPNPQRPGSIKQTGVGSKEITVTWTPGKDLEHYRVEYRKYGTTGYKIAGTTKGLSYKIKSLSTNARYDIKVTSINPAASWEYAYVSLYGACTLPGSVSFSGQESYASSSRYSYRFKSYSYGSVKGYWVRYTNLRTKSAKSVYEGLYSASLPLRNNDFYKIEFKGYTQVNNKKYFGPVRTIYTAQQPKLSKQSNTRTSMTVKWPKVSGANNYSVYVSTKQSGGYKKVKTTTGTTFTKTGMSRGKSYYIYVRANRKVGSTTYSSPATYTTRIMIY